MVVEALSKFIGRKLGRVRLGSRTYEGMEGDIQLVSGWVIEENPTQHVDTVDPDNASDGIAERALERLLRVKTREQIVDLIYRKHGHGQEPLDIQADKVMLSSRLIVLEKSDR